MDTEIDGLDAETQFDNGLAGADAGLFDEAGDGSAERQPVTVPLRALQEEREEKKALRSELEDSRRRSAVLEDRWNTLLTLSEQAQQEPPPDPDQDIFAALKYERQQREALENRLADRDYQAQADAMVAEGQRQIWSFWHQDAAAFKEKAPEFDQAARWMSEQRTQQLKSLAGLNPQLRSEAGIAQQINNELQAIVVSAAQSGASPAATIYEMAKQWGWRGAGESERSEFVPYRGGRKNAAEFSLSSMGGGAHSGPRTPEDVAYMSAAEFEAWLTRNGSRGFKRLMGGA